MLSVFSGFLFGGLSNRLGRKRAAMLACTLFTVTYALAAADLPDLFLFASIGLFGLTVWSIPTIMLATVGDYTGSALAVKAFGFITLFFGAGQIMGPAVAGFIADNTGTFQMAFWLCALLTASAVVLTRFIRPPSPPPRLWMSAWILVRRCPWAIMTGGHLLSLGKSKVVRSN
jgi:MFS family permease